MDDFIRANGGTPSHTIRLILRNLQFPNQTTLNRGWYTGSFSIKHVIIDNCPIQRIGPNAFQQIQLKDMTSLHLMNMVNIESDNDMLNELKIFGGIYLANITICQFYGAILMPLHNTMLEFECIGTNHFTNFNILFGIRRKIRLKIVHYKSVANLTILAASNFSGLPSIQKLIITHCGVEVIMDNAFDHLSMTLTNLDLAYNNLKTYSGHIFNYLIEYNTVMRSIPLRRLTGNPLECNCDVYEAASLLMLVFGEYLIEYATILYVCANQFLLNRSEPIANIELKCENVQNLYANKVCSEWEHTNMYKIGHTRFSMKFDANNDELIVTLPPNVAKYRIWIQLNSSRLMLEENMSDCPTGQWLSTSLICKWHNDGPLHRIPIGNYLQSTEPIVICLNYLLSRGVIKFWPFNCISIKKRPNIDLCHSHEFLSANRVIA